MQVDPIKPTLKAPGIECLKLQYDKPLSKFAFKFNLRRYTVAVAPPQPRRTGWGLDLGQGLTLVHVSARFERLLWHKGCA